MKKQSSVGIFKRYLSTGCEVLLVKRKQEDRTYPDAWCLPGGKRENNEKLSDTLKREVFEEVGLQVEHYRIFDVKENDRFNISFYEIFSYSGNVVLNESELNSFWWFNFNELPETLLPVTKEVLNDMKSFYQF